MICKECTEFGFSEFPSFFAGKRGLFVPCVAVGLQVYDQRRDLHVVMVVTCGVDMMELHTEEPTTIHNCPYRGALHVMNMGEDSVA